jgi:hypothetical protein
MYSCRVEFTQLADNLSTNYGPLIRLSNYGAMNVASEPSSSYHATPCSHLPKRSLYQTPKETLDRMRSNFAICSAVEMFV